jgi:aromatic ring-opening dioxygenase LigB subunit
VFYIFLNKMKFNLFSLLAILTLTFKGIVLDAILVGGILLPHGDFAYDPNLFPPTKRTERQLSKQIAVASRKAGIYLSEVLKPDVILLSTPHGIKLDTDFGIYISEYGKGYATIGMDLHDNSTSSKMYNVSLEIQMDMNMSEELLSTLQKNENVSGIYSYNREAPMPLNWGEIIPLLLLPKAQRYRHLIWSHPQRRYQHSQEMVKEMLRLGKKIEVWARQRPEKIAVIISGDLSHTHLNQGPYGYSNTSAHFDAAVGDWAARPYKKSDSLLEGAKHMQPQAMSCGFTGHVLWHGMLTSAATTKQIMKSNVLANLNVTYYGMVAATFSPLINNDNAADVNIVSETMI